MVYEVFSVFPDQIGISIFHMLGVVQAASILLPISILFLVVSYKEVIFPVNILKYWASEILLKSSLIHQIAIIPMTAMATISSTRVNQKWFFFFIKSFVNWIKLLQLCLLNNILKKREYKFYLINFSFYEKNTCFFGFMYDGFC